jgi:tetratricopeptide (TPR) repeat protein
LRVAVQRDAAGRRTAEVLLAELAYRRGDREESLRRASAIVAEYEQSPGSADDKVAAGRAYVILGSRSAQDVRSALAAFDRAVAADPRNVEGRLRAGDLFLEKYNPPEAKASYEDVIRRDKDNARALLGLARLAEFEGKKDSQVLVRRSLAANPSLADAHVFLARFHLEAEAYDSAANEARRAVQLDPSSMPGWAFLGATAWLTGDSATYHEAKRAAEHLNPRPSEFYVQIAEAAIRQRRYEDGVRLAQEALALDSTSVRALGLLGTNELRGGHIAAGRASLEKAFAIDPFNLFHKNTLDLLDELAKFKTIDRGHFQIVAPQKEADLLATYLLPLLEQEYDSLVTRYDYRPPSAVRLEIYDAHADFSVRTVGLAGLGALGVSFGPVLAMDSPSARTRGEFNWGSTAWHELAHTFTLGLSRNRSPRWLSEGLSVLEERRARPEWGAKESLEYFGTYKAGRIRPVSELNDGFVRPRYDSEVILSYYDASLVCEMIEEVYGQKAIVDMLKGYRDGGDTPGVFTRVLHSSLADFDKKFDAWVRAKFAAPFASIAPDDGKGEPAGPFVDAMRKGVEYLGANQVDSAKAELTRAEALFPGYAGSQNPAELLAKIAFDKLTLPEALSQIQRITTRNESAWRANELEASFRELSGDSAGAIVPLQRMIWISPYDVAVHARIADLAARRGDWVTAVRERRVNVMLHPSDMLSARYELARALAGSGDAAGAKKELLAVLEEAPSFEKAQALLLELRNKAGSP